jgi:hypothetical protein
MLHMRWIFHAGLLLVSNLATGQDVSFYFKSGLVQVQGIGKQSDHQLVMGNNKSEVFDFSKGDLYRHNEKDLPSGFGGQYLWDGYFFVNRIDLARIKSNIVAPREIFDSEGVHYNLDSMPTRIFTENLHAKNVTVYVDSVWISSNHDTIGSYHIISRRGGVNFRSSIVYLLIRKSRFICLRVENAIFNSRSMFSERSVFPYDIKEAIIDSLIFSGIELRDEFIIKSTPLPKYIRLNEIVCKNKTGQLDLTQFLMTDSSAVCDLSIGKEMPGLIKANYKYFNLIFESATSMYEKERIYTELLNMQRSNYFLDGYEKLDKEYKAFKYLNKKTVVSRLENWIDKHWWDYGYDKFKVLANSVKLFFVFFVINLLLYKELTKVYHPEKFKSFVERSDNSNLNLQYPIANYLKKYIGQAPVVFLYTAFLFWGVKFDLDELELKKPFYMTLIIGQYIVGLICLAYIANYIISK